MKALVLLALFGAALVANASQQSLKSWGAPVLATRRSRPVPAQSSTHLASRQQRRPAAHVGPTRIMNTVSSSGRSLKEAAEPAGCSNQLGPYAQCGGKSGCSSGNCDQQWPGSCCPSGFTCQRSNEWYHQCAPSGGNSGGGGGNNQPQPQPNPNPTPQPNDPSQYKPDPPVPAKKVNGDYDYGQVLGLSFKFYEAQRSGKLPPTNRIKWRADSGLDHRAPDGRDVTGGWYDAGDNVKFNLPMAWSAGVLAWSLVDFKDGYVESGEYATALDNLKWVTDYFIKCVGDGTEIVVQVGNGQQDHSIWGRPEDVKGPVPVYTVTKDRPGSDVVGAMGAALAAAAVAFKPTNPAYSANLLDAATKAYNFASKYPGSYSNSVPDAANFYRSSNYYDDVALNAIWLYYATGSDAYKKAGYDLYMKHWNTEDGKGVWDNFDWDSNSWADVVLLNRLYPNDALIQSRIDGFITSWTKGSQWVQFTPKGLAYSGPWGSLRHVGNAMFLMKAYTSGKNVPSSLKSSIDCTVKQQLGYILGDTGRSFVVGYGTNPPQRPHHRASSCPPLGVPCTWDYFNNPGPNPHTLYGALVGGPGSQDDYTDARNDYIKNEVATDYNAGFTGALAAAEEGLICGKSNSKPNDEPAITPAEPMAPTQPPAAAETPVETPDKAALPVGPAVPVIPDAPITPITAPPEATLASNTSTAVEPKACTTQLKAWDQCGGRSGCTGANCGDQEWPGHCCPVGYKCVRNDAWYYNCQGGMNNGGGNNGGGNSGGGSQGPISYTPDPPVPAKKVNGDYDYGQVLGLSFKFYEAQRSGKLPPNNRIKWRADSGLDHRAPDGRDVTGGWYDAGDNVKFNLPMAWSAGVLAWSIVDFKDGYVKSGEYATALDNLKWVTDYFIKCVGDGTEIVVQVGNGQQDHSIWGRPEDVKGPVPVYTVTKDRPGSDVVGAMGAALAAAAVAFKPTNPAYSAKLLEAATKAYNFAAKYPGFYSNSVQDAASFYRSSNYWDDVAFNALWLYQATGDEKYKQAGYDLYMKHWNTEDGKGVWDNYDWDSNSWGDVVLLNRFFPNDKLIQSRINNFITSWTKGSQWVQFTPKGLAYSGPWGSLRHVGNAMFLMKAYLNEARGVSPAVRAEIDCTVRSQLGYILGDTGRSFVVGYGTNPPQRPHHRASSCPPLGQQCTWDYFNNPGPNPHTLYGALVGGPGPQDDYTDARNDYIKNEVATDYNAGFTGALAAAAEGLKCGPASRRPGMDAPGGFVEPAEPSSEIAEPLSDVAEPAPFQQQASPDQQQPIPVEQQPVPAEPATPAGSASDEPIAAAPAAEDSTTTDVVDVPATENPGSSSSSSSRSGTVTSDSDSSPTASDQAAPTLDSDLSRDASEPTDDAARPRQQRTDTTDTSSSSAAPAEPRSNGSAQTAKPSIDRPRRGGLGAAKEPLRVNHTSQFITPEEPSTALPQQQPQVPVAAEVTLPLLPTADAAAAAAEPVEGPVEGAAGDAAATTATPTADGVDVAPAAPAADATDAAPAADGVTVAPAAPAADATAAAPATPAGSKTPVIEDPLATSAAAAVPAATEPAADATPAAAADETDLPADAANSAASAAPSATADEATATTPEEPAAAAAAAAPSEEMTAQEPPAVAASSQAAAPTVVPATEPATTSTAPAAAAAASNAVASAAAEPQVTGEPADMAPMHNTPAAEVRPATTATASADSAAAAAAAAPSTAAVHSPTATAVTSTAASTAAIAAATAPIHLASSKPAKSAAVAPTASAAAAPADSAAAKKDAVFSVASVSAAAAISAAATAGGAPPATTAKPVATEQMKPSNATSVTKKLVTAGDKPKSSSPPAGATTTGDKTKQQQQQQQQQSQGVKSKPKVASTIANAVQTAKTGNSMQKADSKKVSATGAPAPAAASGGVAAAAPKQAAAQQTAVANVKSPKKPNIVALPTHAAKPAAGKPASRRLLRDAAETRPAA